MSEPTTDDECIEEEFLVFADFQTKISADILNDPDVKIKVIGFEEQHPIMQVNNKMFQGTFEHSMGTHVFFAEDPKPPTRLHLYEPEPDSVYKLFATTEKVVVMNRLFVEPKVDDEKAASDLIVSTDAADSAPIPITMSYAMALNQFLQPGEKPPRTLDDGSDRFYRNCRTDGGDDNDDEMENYIQGVVDDAEEDTRK